MFGGWLIALMVWLLPAAGAAARPWVIVIITYLVALGGFAHIIAGSVEALAAVLSGAATWADYLLGFLPPTLIGNILGGTALVAALNYAQVVAGTDGDGEDRDAEPTE